MFASLAAQSVCFSAIFKSDLDSNIQGLDEGLPHHCRFPLPLHRHHANLSVFIVLCPCPSIPPYLPTVIILALGWNQGHQYEVREMSEEFAASKQLRVPISSDLTRVGAHGNPKSPTDPLTHPQFGTRHCSKLTPEQLPPTATGHTRDGRRSFHSSYY